MSLHFLSWPASLLPSCPCITSENEPYCWASTSFSETKLRRQQQCMPTCLQGLLKRANKESRTVAHPCSHHCCYYFLNVQRASLCLVITNTQELPSRTKGRGQWITLSLVEWRRSMSESEERRTVSLESRRRVVGRGHASHWADTKGSLSVLNIDWGRGRAKETSWLTMAFMVLDISTQQWQLC